MKWNSPKAFTFAYKTTKKKMEKSTIDNITKMKYFDGSKIKIRKRYKLIQTTTQFRLLE